MCPKSNNHILEILTKQINTATINKVLEGVMSTEDFNVDIKWDMQEKEQRQYKLRADSNEAFMRVYGINIQPNENDAGWTSGYFPTCIGQELDLLVNDIFDIAKELNNYIVAYCCAKEMCKANNDYLIENFVEKVCEYGSWDDQSTKEKIIIKMIKGMRKTIKEGFSPKTPDSIIGLFQDYYRLFLDEDSNVRLAHEIKRSFPKYTQQKALEDKNTKKSENVETFCIDDLDLLPF